MTLLCQDFYRVNTILPPGSNPACPRGSNRRAFSTLSTNGVSLDTVNSQTVYGINPCDYRELPCESLILLTIHADVPTGGEAFPVMLALPNNGQSTTTTSNTPENTGVRKVNIVDSQGNNVTGASVQGTTERLLYLNKRTGVARFMEFTVPAAAAASVSLTTPTI